MSASWRQDLVCLLHGSGPTTGLGVEKELSKCLLTDWPTDRLTEWMKYLLNISLFFWWSILSVLLEECSGDRMTLLSYVLGSLQSGTEWYWGEGGEVPLPLGTALSHCRSQVKSVLCTAIGKNKNKQDRIDWKVSGCITHKRLSILKHFVVTHTRFHISV